MLWLVAFTAALLLALPIPPEGIAST